MMWDNGGGWWIWMSVWMVVFWGLVIVAIVALANWFGSNRGGGGDTPEDTLRRRLAAGEINQEEYRGLLEELRGRPHGPATAH